MTIYRGTARGDELGAAFGYDSNVIRCRGGDDYATGALGSDWIYGGAGNDTLRGWSGADAIFGGTGNDILIDDITDPGDTERDELSGGAGNDSLLGGMGGDVLQGGSGNDYLRAISGVAIGGRGSDWLAADAIPGVASSTTLVGGRGADTFAPHAVEDGIANRIDILDFRPGEGDRLDFSMLLADGREVASADAWRALDGDWNSRIDSSDYPTFYGSAAADSVANTLTLTLAGDVIVIHGWQAVSTTDVIF